jgi:multidrug efflux pump subunit AcrA (membrane-fusion protein)
VKEGWKMRERTILKLAALLAVSLLLAAAGCAGRSGPVPVTTAVAADKELETVLEISGALVPVQSVDISSKFTGKVAGLAFNVGSAVRAGDILIQLETDTLASQLQQAQAGLESAEAAVESALSQASLAQINLDAAQKLYDRTKVLYDAGAVSQNQMDDVADKLEAAQYQFENASGPAQDQARAAVSTALANINNYQLQIESATIKSPIDGYITSRNVNIGQVITTGTTIITLVDISTLKLKSTVSQDVLPFLAAGGEMDVAVDSYPDIKLKGTITSIGPIAVSTGGMFPVEITVSNKGSLAAGLSARAHLAARVKGVTVPLSAVAQGGGESYVFVIRDNIAVKRPVKTGMSSGSTVQILQGLEAGEIVAATNVGSLSDNMQVSAD